MAQYVYGKNVVSNLINSNHKVLKLIVLPRENDEIVRQARDRHIAVSFASRRELDELAEGNHQGYVALIEDYRLYSIEEITAAANKQYPLVVALDGIQDPHNLGAVLRTVECVGGDGVIIEKNRSVSLNPTVAKVSVGAIERVKVAQVTNLVQTLKKLKKQGYWIVGTDVRQASDYRSLKYDMPVVLVIGAEGTGVRPLVLKECDFKVKLPMEGTVGSLNASVACGILLYQIYSQRFPL